MPRKSAPTKRPTTPDDHPTARPKGGRPRAGALPENVLAAFGPPPTNPIHAAEWWANLLQTVALGYAKGHPWKEMLQELRATAATISKLLPDSIKNKALQVLREQEAEADDETVTVEEEDNTDESSPLRVNP